MDRLVLPMGSVDFRREEVRTPHGKRIELRPRAFAVLRCLASHAERVVGKDDLLAECWPGTIVTEESLTQCISDIREALGDSARDVIRTIPRRGYMLMPPAQPAPAVQPFAQGVTHLWPVVAVLPFDSFAGGPPLGAMLADDISTELARSRDLSVLARQQHGLFGRPGHRLHRRLLRAGAGVHRLQMRDRTERIVVRIAAARRIGFRHELLNDDIEDDARLAAARRWLPDNPLSIYAMRLEDAWRAGYRH